MKNISKSKLLSICLAVVVLCAFAGCGVRTTDKGQNETSDKQNVTGSALESVAAGLSDIAVNADVSSGDIPTISIKNSIGKDDYVHWTIKSPSGDEDRATLTYNGTVYYICDCGSTIAKKDRINYRVAQVTDEEMKMGEETHQCYLTQSETVNLARRDVEEFVNVALNDYKITNDKLELTPKELSDSSKANIQLYADLIIKDFDQQYSIEDVTTNYVVSDIDGNEYPLHVIWEVHNTADGTVRRLQATYVVYDNYHLMIRPVTGYDDSTYSVATASSETTDLNWLAIDIYTAERIANAKSEKEVKDIYNANKYVLSVNDKDAISEEDASSYLIGIQNNIVIGAYVPAE